MMTYGLGFYEYFQMCEDLGMEPVPILNCGIACQVRSGSATDEEHLVPMDKLQPYIDDALDLIEFANGTADTKWGKIRCDMGHPSRSILNILQSATKKSVRAFGTDMTFPQSHKREISANKNNQFRRTFPTRR